MRVKRSPGSRPSGRAPHLGSGPRSCPPGRPSRPRASASGSRRDRPGALSVPSLPWVSDPSLGTVSVGGVPTVPSPARRTGHLRPGAWDRARDRARLPAWDRTWFPAEGRNSFPAEERTWFATGWRTSSHRGRAVGTGDFAYRRGHQGGHGDRRVPVPQRDRVRGPEPAVALLALRAGQPTERIDPPPGRDRTGADVGLAERRRVRVMRYAGAHLAPGEGYPQLVADRRPLGNLDAGLRPRPAGRRGLGRHGGGPGIGGGRRGGAPGFGGGRRGRAAIRPSDRGRHGGPGVGGGLHRRSSIPEIRGG